jgi:hypothetical protein
MLMVCSFGHLKPCLIYTIDGCSDPKVMAVQEWRIGSAGYMLNAMHHPAKQTIPGLFRDCRCCLRTVFTKKHMA